MSEENKPQTAQAQKRRALVPVAKVKIRTGPAFDDAIMPGDEIPEGLLKSAPHLVKGEHYEMAALVAR